MSSDSDSSASSEEHRKQKKNKKLKRKSEKKKHKKKERKEKRHKDKKHYHKEKIRVEPNLLISNLDKRNETIDGGEDAFGPALPPHLLKEDTKTDKTLIGPTLPREFSNSIESVQPKSSEMSENDNAAASIIDGEIEDMDLSYGPMPISNDSVGLAKMSSTQIELEQRALELKLAAIEGTGNTTDVNVREEWMLELPEVGLKSGLAALSNMKRTFHQGKEKPDFNDRSSWTKTPHDETKPSTSTSKAKTAEALKRSAEETYEKQRDEEQARLAKKHKKQHKRDESLVEIHQKKLRKEQKQREKELASAGAKPERRPFSRDVDLKLNKIDKNQTKQIVDKAKILNTKFASGKTKYL